MGFSRRRNERETAYERNATMSFLAREPAAACRSNSSTTAARWRLRSLQQGDNLLCSVNQRIGIGLGNGLSALGLDRIDESAQRIDCRAIILRADPIKGVERRIQLRV